MVDTPNDERAQGERLLNAVERLIDAQEDLITFVEALKEEMPQQEHFSNDAYTWHIARKIIGTYSTRSAIAGAVTAMPAMIPGGGTVIAVVGGSLADMGLMLKHEVEMVLCLAYLFGHDIRDERERWLALVLASVSTYEAESGRNYFRDLADAELEAIMKYTPRQLAKVAVAILGKLALTGLSKGLVKAVPLVGIAISASANKILTQSVGWRCVEALNRRRKAYELSSGPVVDATVI